MDGHLVTVRPSCLTTDELLHRLRLQERDKLALEKSERERQAAEQAAAQQSAYDQQNAFEQAQIASSHGVHGGHVGSVCVLLNQFYPQSLIQGISSPPRLGTAALTPSWDKDSTLLVRSVVGDPQADTCRWASKWASRWASRHPLEWGWGCTIRNRSLVGFQETMPCMQASLGRITTRRQILLLCCNMLAALPRGSLRLALKIPLCVSELLSKLLEFQSNAPSSCSDCVILQKRSYLI